MYALRLLAGIGRLILTITIKGVLLSMPIAAQFHPPDAVHQCGQAPSTLIGEGR